MKKRIVPITTWRSVLHQLIAWLEPFALVVLGLTGPSLMTPGVVEADNTAIRDCDDPCPVLDCLADEDLAIRQVRVTVGTRGYVGPCACWTHFLLRLFDLSRDDSCLNAA